MARTRTGTGDADRAGAGAGAGAADARLGVGAALLLRAGELLVAAATLGGRAAVVALRGAMPVLELYTGTTRAIEQDGGDGEGRDGGLERFGLTRGEAGVARKACTKGLLEALEVSSVTHPVYPGAPAFRARNPDGGVETPQLIHFLALAAAAAALWRRWEGSCKPPEEPVDVPDESRTVAYVAVRPGEYAYLSAPLPPSEIRRYAMRQRSLSTPRAAMLADSRSPDVIVAARTAPARGQIAGMPRAGSAPAARSGCGCGGGGGGGAKPCGCGGAGSGCTCGGHGGRSFPPARHEADGSCASLFSVSCETRWRIRECVKLSFCDFLRCVGDELCEREPGVRPDLSGCLEGFVCSLLECLPDAICPPPEPCEPCAPLVIDACHCNFAVGR